MLLCIFFKFSVAHAILGDLKTLIVVFCEVCVKLKSCKMFVKTITMVLALTKNLNMLFCQLATIEHNLRKGTLMSCLLSDNCVAFGRIMSVFIHVIFCCLDGRKKKQLPKSFKCVFGNMFSTFLY